MANDRPNFIFILTDDQGWSGTSVCMDTKIADQFQNRYKTPAIQRLATEGVCFLLDMYLRSVCSPTRYSIQWGQSVARHGITDVKMLYRGKHVFEDRDSIAEVLKKLDERYVTAHFANGIYLEIHQNGIYFSDGETGNKEGGFALNDEYTTRLRMIQN